MSGIRSRCAALNCQSTTSLTHRFPKDYERCRIWAERAGCLHLLAKGVEVLNTSYRLCSDHFHDRCYTSTERKRLSNFALPEIFFHNSDNSEAENLDYQPRSYFKSEEPTEINLDLQCRICACTSDELVPVFGEQGLELQLLDKIHTHLPIMVTAEDLLPVTVCTDCIYKLEICHELVHSCLEGDAKLRTILGLDTNNEVYSGEHDEAQFSPLQSSPKMEHDSDNEEDTDMFKDSSGEQDDSNHMEDTHMLRVPKDEPDNVDYYAHDEYVFEDSSDSQLDDGAQDSTDQMQEMESASAPPEDSRDIRSQSLGKKEPKFKVVVVKIKNVTNMAPDAQIEKALDHLKNVQATSEPAETKYLLTEHMRVHTNERPFKCVHCGKTFHKRSQLSQHTLIHADARQHKCPVCERGFNRVGNMKVHLKTHQQSSKYTCKICKEAFENLGELNDHRKTHCKEEVGEAMKHNESQGSEPLMYVCDVCGKLLATKLTLKYHMMIHEEDRPFSCETCGKKFALKTKLQLHQKIHSSVKPYRCRFCNEGFQTKQYQVVHERIHTGEKPYECTQCEKAFRSRISLNQHTLVHSDVRPFRCHHCDKGFRRRDTLDTHLRTHTGERPYSCQICDRRFKQKGDCNKHQKTHSKGRKAAAQIQDSSVPVIFCCMLCGLNFNQKEELEGHFKAFHTPDLMVSSSTMIINTDDFVALPEIVQNEKTIILPSFGPGCDSN